MISRDSQKLLFSLFIFITLPHFIVSKFHAHQNHRYAYSLPITVPTEDPLEDDDEITNEDTVLDVAIIPPLRLNIFETPMVLSQSGIDALVKAMNEHATYRMQLYFRDTIYFFDKVEFELLEVSTLRSGGSRNRRVFELEEEEVRAEWEQDSNRDENEKGGLRRRKREVQQVNQQKMYGTS